MRTPPRHVLVVVTRRIGDVLLATPVVRSLKQAWPHAQIHMLVFGGTEGLLTANADITRVLTIAERPGTWRHIVFIANLIRRYDLALSLVPGDRPTFYAWLAGRARVGLLLDNEKEKWKRVLLHQWVPFDNLNTHTVRMNLALVGALGIAIRGDMVTAWHDDDARQADQVLGADKSQPIAVLHPFPKFNYKMWRRDGWIEIARWLAARGYRVVLSGGNDAAELAYAADLIGSMPSDTINATGKLSLGASASVVSRAAVYIGPDTALTHAAAALGVPTIALYGPTNPVKWGPWPRGQTPDANPWQRCGSQRSGNVTLLQGVAACVPCTLEGCGRLITSFSDCLQSLPVAKVIAAIKEQLQ